MKSMKTPMLALFILFLVSLGSLLYGNVVEREDMLKSGFQTFGFIGTLCSAIGLLALVIYHEKKRERDKIK